MDRQCASGRVVLTATTILFLTSIGGLAATGSARGGAPPAKAAAPAGAPGEQRATQDLAHSILARLPAVPGRRSACEPPTLDTLRASVTAAIAQVDPSRDVALAAVSLARSQAPASDACVLAALDDTADELDGSGATVDDVGKVRGFALYMGPLPNWPGRTRTP